MKVLGIRHCAVLADAESFSDFLGKGLGLPSRNLGGADDPFAGEVYFLLAMTAGSRFGPPPMRCPK